MTRIGIDFGGTKIEAAALDAGGEVLARMRVANPGSYQAAVTVVRDLVGEIEKQAGISGASIGVGAPGSVSPKTGMIRNANSTWMNGKPFREDVEAALGRPIRIENDANCFALSEAVDGAGADAEVVFGAILGTGCGGGVVVRGQTVAGANGIGGEWGHTPLPWPRNDELPGTCCWCGRPNCLETWISGTGFERDYQRATGNTAPGMAIARAASSGEKGAVAALDRYIDRLGRALAVVCDILDPDVIVLGGGMSKTEALYERVPAAVKKHVFSDVFETRIVPAMHGDASGVRGAAWLWPLE